MRPDDLDDDVQRGSDECCERTGVPPGSPTAVESFGDRTCDDWLRNHVGDLCRHGERTGVPFDEDVEQVAFERFALVWPPHRAPEAEPG